MQRRISVCGGTAQHLQGSAYFFVIVTPSNFSFEYAGLKCHHISVLTARRQECSCQHVTHGVLHHETHDAHKHGPVWPTRFELIKSLFLPRCNSVARHSRGRRFSCSNRACCVSTWFGVSRPLSLSRESIAQPSLEEEERFWMDVELINLSLEAVSCTPSPRSCAQFVTRRDEWPQLLGHIGAFVKVAGRPPSKQTALLRRMVAKEKRLAGSVLPTIMVVTRQFNHGTHVPSTPQRTCHLSLLCQEQVPWGTVSLICESPLSDRSYVWREAGECRPFMFERMCLAIYPRLPGEFHSMLWDSDDGRVIMVMSHSRLGSIEVISSLLSCPDVRSARVHMRIATALAAWRPDSMWHSRWCPLLRFRGQCSSRKVEQYIPSHSHRTYKGGDLACTQVDQQSNFGRRQSVIWTEEGVAFTSNTATKTLVRCW